MDTSLLNYPNKSHRKIIHIPKKCTELAELIGIIAGDGGINNQWQLVISMNSVSDLDYSVYITSLIENLFQIKISSRKRPSQNTLVLVATSTSLVNFLVSKGAVRGHKIRQEIDIPNWIKTNQVYQKHFVRGLIDTDGCLYIHKHQVIGKTYRNIGLCFTSYSSNLINSTAEIMKKFGIIPHISKDTHYIYLYSRGAVLKYLSIFGTSNPRISRKYEEWRGRIVV